MGTLSHVNDERTCNGHSTYVDSKILDVTINEQASTGMFVPGFMISYCHNKPFWQRHRPRRHLLSSKKVMSDTSGHMC